MQKGNNILHVDSHDFYAFNIHQLEKISRFNVKNVSSFFLFSILGKYKEVFLSFTECYLIFAFF
jgi:hypothetical protein